MSRVDRIFVKKRQDYAANAKALKDDLIEQLKIKNLRDIIILNRYDIQGIDRKILKQAINTILAEPMVDDIYIENYPFKNKEKVLAIEYLPGQYDQRADSTIQCLSILTGSNDVKVRCARVLIFNNISDSDLKKITNYLINPIDTRVATLDKYKSLDEDGITISPVKIINNFINFNEKELAVFLKDNNLAMNLDDLLLIHDYFKKEKRNPTETEIKVLDTYWSDHCRHTTFNTIINDIEIENGNFKAVLEEDLKSYRHSRRFVYNIKDKPISLMDLATIAAKELRKKGMLDDLEVSEEVNAVSLAIDVKTNKGIEKWLLMFKNETHNHPTEIEPFGGAATCLGGAIRDPLSGRSYVYQAMRITGSGDPRTKMKDTIKGKLMQRKITKEAAKGFSSYGNQIGLTTGYVHEIYDEGYIAKRMEVGAVVGAAPKKQVKRLEPKKGDIVLLIGGRTGRDGCGGATGSSKSHNIDTISQCGAEVQKGNAVEERKIQRLFRDPQVASKIIRCNDFGAGGVSVAIGELAPSININLDVILKKYDGLTGTELAISESQERMAVVVKKKDVAFIIKACHNENLEVVKVAEITNNNRLVMNYQRQTIVDLDRSFLDTNGAKRYQDIKVTLPSFNRAPFKLKKNLSFKKQVQDTLSSLLVCNQKGLVEMFDSSIGANTVLSPYGGKTNNNPIEGMVALIPVLDKETTSTSVVAYGYNPLIAKWSPYHGAIYAIIESISKIVAMGADYRHIRFSFQEYFEKLRDDKTKWGKPFSSLLGAFRVQKALHLPAVGGKDSMSGSFMDLDVPPTLISFAITTTDVNNIITPHFKDIGHPIALVSLKRDKFFIPDFNDLKQKYDKLLQLNKEGKILSAYTVKAGGIIEAITKMTFGNKIGIKLNNNVSKEQLFMMNYGDIVIELSEPINNCSIIGETIKEPYLIYKKDKITLNEIYKWYSSPLKDIFPITTKEQDRKIIIKDYVKRLNIKPNKKIDKPLVIIPVFPGTNCEYDSKRAFEKAGAKVELVIFKNKTIVDIHKSIKELNKAIRRANIVMLAGGFSAGDEPEGSGKFIATVLRNPILKEAIEDLLNNRDGLIIGICNGFQALIKLGLLPYGEIRPLTDKDPTLTFNTIGRHVSQMVRTRVCSINSPWLTNVDVGDYHMLPVSHGEGRFIASKQMLETLFKKGQVITQYVDSEGNPTMLFPYNPNGSTEAIEGIVSPNGRILGKMAHSERIGNNRYKNIYGEMDQKIFEAGVNYFKI